MVSRCFCKLSTVTSFVSSMVLACGKRNFSSLYRLSGQSPFSVFHLPAFCRSGKLVTMAPTQLRLAMCCLLSLSGLLGLLGLPPLFTGEGDEKRASSALLD